MKDEAYCHPLHTATFCLVPLIVFWLNNIVGKGQIPCYCSVLKEQMIPGFPPSFQIAFFLYKSNLLTNPRKPGGSRRDNSLLSLLLKIFA